MVRLSQLYLNSFLQHFNSSTQKISKNQAAMGAVGMKQTMTVKFYWDGNSTRDIKGIHKKINKMKKGEKTIP